MRTHRLALAALALLVNACSYDTLSGVFRVHVDGIPADATHLHVTVTDTAQHKYVFTPTFGPGLLGSIDLEMPDKNDTNVTPAQPGAFTVDVDARSGNFDSPTQPVLASGTGSGTYAAAGQPSDVVVVTLH